MNKTIDQTIISKIQSIAKQYFKNSPPTHDWLHIQRVKQLCQRIGKDEGADLQILELAAILHDIARQEEDRSRGRICHAKRGAELAEAILRENKIDEEIIKQIYHCIRSHRFRNRKLAQTLEAKVLFDSDNLDAMGAIGIARIFAFAGENGLKLYSKEHLAIQNASSALINYDIHTPVLEYKSKLIKLKDAMQTKTGRIIAEKRHKFMIEFFKHFSDEVSDS